MLSSGLFYTIVIITGIGLWFGIAFLLTKMKMNMNLAGSGAILLVFGIYFLVFSGNTRRVYIIEKTTGIGLSASTYINFGKTVNYEKPTPGSIRIEEDECLVINLSDQTLYASRHQYGGLSIFAPEDIVIESNSVVMLGTDEIEYLPGETVPQEVSVTKGVSFTSRWSLHP
ncbi:MAG: hypothetical protein FD123_2588 [Bacteroidetes bacterium]|nr:MAG: hypothetical protein FD123_2588 [Bacteroidota bacterium]